MSRPLPRAGFALVEVMVALVIMAVGLVGVSATMAQMQRQATLAEMDGDRQLAKQYVAERLRGIPFDSVKSGTAEIGAYALNWVVDTTLQGKSVRMITVGPRLAQVGVSVSYSDTLLFTVAP